MNEPSTEIFFKKAFAKINLSLDVTGKAANGYHLLDMIMQTVELADDILISLSADENDSFTVFDQRSCFFLEAGPSSCNWTGERPGDVKVAGSAVNDRESAYSFDKITRCNLPEIPMDGSNIMFKALNLMKSLFPNVGPVHMELIKRIPLQSGLGGGSSDAASVLLGINKLFKLNLSHKRLEELGLLVGADVPFFIRGGTQRVQGIGEKLKVLPCAEKISDFPFHVLIIEPEISCSTIRVYAAYDSLDDRKRIRIIHPDVNNQAKSLMESRRNFTSIGLGKSETTKHESTDLVVPEAKEFAGARVFFNEVENVLFHALPQKDKDLINWIKKMMIDLGAKASCMSGSGAAVFGLFSDSETLSRATSHVKKSNISERIRSIIKTRMCS